MTAIVFHHPEAKYFALSAADIERLERELAPGSKRSTPELIGVIVHGLAVRGVV